MMTCFYAAGSVWQILLLVFSLMAIITLCIGLVLIFRHRSAMEKVCILLLLLMLNILLYVPMQLESNITEANRGLQLPIPYILLLFAVLFSMGYGIRAILRETGSHRTINNMSIKEAFDNLPMAVCFFNEVGLPVLCNRAMHRFSFAVTGQDIQFVTDLQECLSEDFVPAEGAAKNGKMFALADGRMWNLEVRSIADDNSRTYTQYVAMDVTDLQKNRMELTEENARLRRMQADLKQLSANVVAITREEEILNAKMRIHDEMGRCLVEAGKYLREDRVDSIPDSVVSSWKRAISTLKYNNDTQEEDLLEQIRMTCASINLRYVQTGALPRDEEGAYILTCAVRECVTNAVRYAEATELYVRFFENAASVSVEVTNNGKPPEKEITEGGGLSNLRRRTERAGGRMEIRSQPTFRLTVTVPKRRGV